MSQNETQRHFEMNDLDGKMRRAHARAGRVIPQGEVRRMRRANLVLAIVILGLVGTLLMLLGVF